MIYYIFLRYSRMASRLGIIVEIALIIFIMDTLLLTGQKRQFYVLNYEDKAENEMMVNFKPGD